MVDNSPSRTWTRSGVLGRRDVYEPSAWFCGIFLLWKCALVCPSGSMLVPLGHGASQTRRATDRSTLPLSLHLPTCRFPLSIQKEKKRRGGYGAERAAPFPRFWVLTFSSFAFLAVAREKESERLGHIGLPFFIFTLLCVLGSLLIDGLHIPIVTSLRRLSTVGCGGMGAMCLKNGRAVSVQGGKRDGGSYRHFSSGLLLLPGRTGQTFWDRNSSCENIRRRTGGSKVGCVVGGGAQRCCLICVQVYGYSVGREGPTRGITAPCLLDVLLRYNHVLSAWLWACHLRSEGQHRAK